MQEDNRNQRSENERLDSKQAKPGRLEKSRDQVLEMGFDLRRSENDLGLNEVIVEVEDDLPSPPIPTLQRSPSIIEGEKIENSLQDVQNTMPECAEKTLCILFYKFQFEQLKQESAISMIQDKQSIQTDFERLHDQLNEENLYDVATEASLTRCKDYFDGGHYREVYDELGELLGQIRPIDMDLMLTYISKNGEGELKIRDKDVVILLGGTGT